MAAPLFPALCFPRPNPTGTLNPRFLLVGGDLSWNRKFASRATIRSGGSDPRSKRLRFFCSSNAATSPSKLRNYDFSDGRSEVELRLDLSDRGTLSSKDILVDIDDLALRVRIQTPESVVTLMEANNLYGRIKSSETIWYIDEDELVLNLKKYDTDLKWPDLEESWVSLTSGLPQLLKGTSIYIVGNSTEINQMVASKLAVGLGYTPLYTSELLEKYVKQPVDSLVIADGIDSVSEAEAAIIEGLSCHARTVVATLGGQYGAAKRSKSWRHLHAGFTIWLSESEATDEISAREEARRNMTDGNVAYTNAEIVLKLGGWEPDSAQAVTQACLSALKQLILSDNQLTGKKSLYVRLGCRGDWPDIKPPGWNPSTEDGFG